MSLSLLQGYSSAEEEADQSQEERHHNFSDDDDDDTDSDDDDNATGAGAVSRLPSSYRPVDAPKSSSAGSALPSALDAFSEIAGPPQFLNHSVEAPKDSVVHHRGRKKSRDKKDLPAGAVVEAKAQLVGIHERVRSDVEGSAPSVASTKEGGPPPSLCLQCGIPKTYSSARGMVCPVCPSADDAKKKGSTVKDKEKVKRMRGQSSHATWKSETEMHLRQQFD